MRFLGPVEPANATSTSTSDNRTPQQVATIFARANPSFIPQPQQSISSLQSTNFIMTSHLPRSRSRSLPYLQNAADHNLSPPPPMRDQSWLPTCSSASCTTVSNSFYSSSAPIVSTFSETLSPLYDHPYYSPSDAPSISTSSGGSNSSSSIDSLQSNLSLQTLPSVPSLQTLTPDTLNLSISYSCLTSFKPRAAQVSCLSISNHNNLLYAASGNEINVYDLSSNDYSHVDKFNTNDPSTGSVKSIAFCNGNVLTSHQNGKIKVWNDNRTSSSSSNIKHKLVTTLPKFNDRLRRGVLPKNYVTVRRHKKVLWIDHADAVSGLAFSKDTLCSISWDKTLKFWRPHDLRCTESITAHDDAVNAVTISADGTVYTGSADRKIRVWTQQQKRHVLSATLEKHKSAVNALALSEDGSVLFSGACDRSILVWEREDSANYMAVTGALRGHGMAILCLINLGELLISGSADRTVRVWRRGASGQYCCLAVLDDHASPVKSLVAFRATDNVVLVISGCLDGEIKVWQLTLSSGG